MVNEKELISEIELAEKSLRQNIANKEREASEKIDQLISLKKSDFCSRCGRRVGSRMQWSGHCLHNECENLICNSCWIVEKTRFCKEHFKNIIGDEEEGEEKIFFRNEPTPIKTPLIKEPSTLDNEWKEKIEKLTNSYIELLKDRLQKNYPDFTPEEFIEKPRAKALVSDEELNATINKKTLLKKEPKLRILVRPLFGKEKSDLDFTIDNLKVLADVYTIVILVGDEVSNEAVNHLNHFNNPKLSIILTQPDKGLTYTDSKQLTKIYLKWFSEDQPGSLKDVLRSISDSLDGRSVLTTDAVSKEFGLTESESRKLLKSCHFLDAVEETNSFFFKL